MLEPSQPDDLSEAAAANQTEWFARVTEAAGGSVHREAGITWTSTPGGPTFAFPRLSQERLELLLPRFLEDAVDTREASCWSLLPTHPPELGGGPPGRRVPRRLAGALDGSRRWRARGVASARGESVSRWSTCRGADRSAVGRPGHERSARGCSTSARSASGTLAHGEAPGRSGMPRSTSRPTSSASRASTTWVSQPTSAGAESARRSRRRLSSWDGRPAVELRH